MLPVPPFSTKSEEWKESSFDGRYHLSSEGIIELRSALRLVRKERSELARSWLTSLTGLIGVLIGLLAIILGRR